MQVQPHEHADDAHAPQPVAVAHPLLLLPSCRSCTASANHSDIVRVRCCACV